MSHPRPENMPWMLPYLIVSDARKSVEFYQKAFAFELISQTKDDNDVVKHAEMRYKDMVIMFCSEGAYGSTTKTPNNGHYTSAVNLYFYVDDVDLFYERVVDAGGNVFSEPVDQFWGDRSFEMKDPDGHAFVFATHMKDTEKA